MNYIFIISHSAGELDIVLPIILDLIKNKKNHIEILITRKDIFYSIKKDEIYIKILQSNKICYKFSPLFNKFEHANYNKIAARLYKFFLSIIFLTKNIKIIKSDYIFFETTNQISKDLVFYVLNSFLKKKFLIIHHGHSYNFPIKKTKLNPAKPNNYKYLIFSKKHIPWCKSMGYYNYHIIGFTKFYDNWIKEISKYKNLYQKNSYVIFSRPPHKYYMSKKNYEYLLNTSIQSILKFDKNCNIIIKPHPREKIYQIKRSLRIQYRNIKNIKFSYINSMSLCRNAKLVISFFTSAILESIIYNKPALEYYIENKYFKKVEPLGSPYKNLGFTYIKNQKKLNYYLKHPNKIKKINKKSFSEFNFKRFKLI